MGEPCRLCRRPTTLEDCYVRVERGDHPACRPCWEQLLLDPRRVLRSLQEHPSDPSRPSASSS